MILNLDTLKLRREELSLRFAKKALKTEHGKRMFPLNLNFSEDSLENNRHAEIYKLKFASTGRLQDSAIPSMQRALNKDHLSKMKK
jgi:hypothetical protein